MAESDGTAGDFDLPSSSPTSPLSTLSLSLALDLLILKRFIIGIEKRNWYYCDYLLNQTLNRNRDILIVTRNNYLMLQRQNSLPPILPALAAVIAALHTTRTACIRRPAPLWRTSPDRYYGPNPTPIVGASEANCRHLSGN